MTAGLLSVRASFNTYTPAGTLTSPPERSPASNTGVAVDGQQMRRADPACQFYAGNPHPSLLPLDHRQQSARRQFLQHGSVGLIEQQQFLGADHPFEDGFHGGRGWRGRLGDWIRRHWRGRGGLNGGRLGGACRRLWGWH